jgi:hypothetical protein
MYRASEDGSGRGWTTLFAAADTGALITSALIAVTGRNLQCVYKKTLPQ